MTNIYDTMTSMSGLAGPAVAKAGPDLSSPAVAAPLTPAAEKAALEWLDNWGKDTVLSQLSVCNAHVATLKAVLAQPRLPAELNDELVEKIWWACDGSKHREVAEKIVGAIRTHLTRPAVRTVWRVTDLHGPTDFDSYEDAMARVGFVVRHDGSVFIKRCEVPND